MKSPNPPTDDVSLMSHFIELRGRFIRIFWQFWLYFWRWLALAVNCMT